MQRRARRSTQPLGGGQGTRIVSGPNSLLLEITEVIPLTLPTAGDACFTAEVSTGDFSGRGSSWVEALALDDFLSALRSMDHTRKGEARIESMSPGELQLRVYSVDSWVMSRCPDELPRANVPLSSNLNWTRPICPKSRAQLRGPGARCHLTNRSSGRVRGKVPSPYIGVRAAQLNR